MEFHLLSINCVNMIANCDQTPHQHTNEFVKHQGKCYGRNDDENTKKIDVVLKRTS